MGPGGLPPIPTQPGGEAGGLDARPSPQRCTEDVSVSRRSSGSIRRGPQRVQTPINKKWIWDRIPPAPSRQPPPLADMDVLVWRPDW